MIWGPKVVYFILLNTIELWKLCGTPRCNLIQNRGFSSGGSRVSDGYVIESTTTPLESTTWHFLQPAREGTIHKWIERKKGTKLQHKLLAILRLRIKI